MTDYTPPVMSAFVELTDHKDNKTIAVISGLGTNHLTIVSQEPLDMSVFYGATVLDETEAFSEDA